MAEKPVQRRLAAILAADVVGYSRLMGQDEVGTLAAVKAIRAELIDIKIAEHNGRIFKVTGDGVLAEFPSVVNAVACAVDIQRGMQGRNADLPGDNAIKLRIGVNLGDVIVEDDDLFGDGVNVAARLEGIAVADGIAVSAVVRDQIGNRLELQFEDLGEHTLKNIATPIRVYTVRSGLKTSIPRPTLALPNKPSIAVLPFQNMSGDPEQEYFADGIVEDIITALSRFDVLFVIARNSSFTYKGRAVDVKQVGRELGVRYVLEGSVRKSGSRVRITGQLIDTSTGAHLWADRFDGGLEDVFDLQDRITSSVVGAIAPRVERAEIERAKRKPTESLDAYDHYLRGLAGAHHWSAESVDSALFHFRRAIELDPEFAAPYGLAARCYGQLKARGYLAGSEQELIQAEWLAKRAAELGPSDAVALSTAGLTLAYVVGDLEAGVALTDRALALNPNLGSAWFHGGWVKLYSGEPRMAIERFTKAMRLSPTDSELWPIQDAMCAANFVMGDFQEAIKWANSALSAKPDFALSRVTLAACNQLLGRSAEAQREVQKLLASEPALRVSDLRKIMTELRHPEQFSTFATALHEAGLPE